MKTTILASMYGPASEVASYALLTVDDNTRETLRDAITTLQAFHRQHGTFGPLEIGGCFQDEVLSGCPDDYEGDFDPCDPEIVEPIDTSGWPSELFVKCDSHRLFVTAEGQVHFVVSHGGQDAETENLAPLLALTLSPQPAGPEAERGTGLAEEAPVKVIFRKFTAKDGEVYALFPEIPASLNPNECTIYAHVGQHGSGLAGAIHGTRPATPAEREPLVKELLGIGYKLEIVDRFTPTMAATRKAAIR